MRILQFRTWVRELCMGSLLIVPYFVISAHA